MHTSMAQENRRSFSQARIYPSFEYNETLSPEGHIVCAAKDLNQHTGKIPKVFDDPMLVTVGQRALEQNLDLSAAFARVRQAQATAAAAGAQLLPTANLEST